MGITLFYWQCDVEESGARQFGDAAIICETAHYHLAGSRGKRVRSFEPVIFAG
jgi:hypothetical protein